MPSKKITMCNSIGTTIIQYEQFIKDSGISEKSPIDDYLNYTQQYYIHIKPILGSSAHSSSAILPLISAVELYIRQVVSGCIAICPIAKRRSDDNDVNLGSIRYYGRNIARAINEKDSLASSTGISTFLEKTIGVKIINGSSAADSLEYFDKVCKVRHAAVHSRGYLAYNNAKEIGVADLKSEKYVYLDEDTYQDIYSVCNNVVRSINSAIYDALISRWIKECIIIGDWLIDSSRWNMLIGLLYSEQDNPEGTSDPQVLWGIIRASAAARHAALNITAV